MSWIGTFSGKKFDFLDPDPESIDIEDIAVALSRKCRFGAQTRQFYSVAQHCVFVSNLCDEYPFEGLMHDASESYMEDLPSPLKAMLPEYKRLENKVMEAIADKFGLRFPLPVEVKKADHIMLETEHRDLMPSSPMWTREWGTPMTATIKPWSIDYSRKEFLRRYHELSRRAVVV